LFLLYIINSLLKSPITVNPSPTPVSKIATFGTIVPGTSTESDVSNVWGRPISTNEEGSQKISEYKSSNQYRFNQATFTNGTATLIKEIVNSNDNKDVGSITSVYGVAQNVLYEKLPSSVFNLYVYPQNGIAYLGAKDGTLKEIWYFQPTTIESFMTDWGQNFSKTKVEDTNTY
jgi:hypothetical protein